MRFRRDLDDLEPGLLDQEEARERREAREQRRLDAERQGRERDAEDATLAARVRGFLKESNDRALADEYRAAGVRPLKVDAAGVPTCSLSLLLWMNWSILDVDGERKLVAPPPYVHKPRAPQECS